jgi:hypothetical protein
MESCSDGINVRTRKTPISEKILEAQAKEVAVKSSKSDLKPSNGWLKNKIHCFHICLWRSRKYK